VTTTPLETADPRARLLGAAVDHILAHGLSDLSLRELATAIGTSHRMLIYHFGSKAGLVVAVIQTVEAAQRTALAELDTAGLSPADTLRAMWRRFTDPSLGPHERLFFEIYGQALQGRPGAVGLLDGIIDNWVEPAAADAIARGQAPDAARAEARLGVAVIRGLLLDWLATDDRAGVDAAFERYVALLFRESARDDVTLRPARPDEAAALSDLVRRSKAHWGYSDEFIEACRDELTVHREQIDAGRVLVATVNGMLAGTATLGGEPPEGDVEMFFVEPEHIGTGVGGALFAAVRRRAVDAGFTRLRIEADPNALGF
jgi:AcrR family transcriptional regulator